MPSARYADYGSTDPEWKRIDWRDHLRTVELDGARVRYVDAGEGPPVILVHGLGGCWQNWLENIPSLMRRHRVLALDLPGFGESPMPDWELSIPAYGRMLVELCAHLELDSPAALVGSSMGGFIATEAAIHHPQHFSHLVLVSAAGVSFARTRNEPAKVAGRIVNLARPAIVAFGRGAVARPRLRWIAFGGVLHRPDLLGRELLTEVARSGFAPEGFNDAIIAMSGYDARERLEEIEIPTLIVWGYNDRIVPVRAALSYRRRIANSRLEIFDRTGHAPMIERPARFNALLEDFLGSRGDGTV